MFSDSIADGLDERARSKRRCLEEAWRTKLEAVSSVVSLRMLLLSMSLPSLELVPALNMLTSAKFTVSYKLLSAIGRYGLA
jgi:hypothetical protein